MTVGGAVTRKGKEQVPPEGKGGGRESVEGTTTRSHSAVALYATVLIENIQI